MSLKTEAQQQSDISFECPICLKKFPYRYRLKQHERSLHKTTRYRSNKSLKKERIAAAAYLLQGDNQPSVKMASLANELIFMEAFSSLNRLQYSRVHQGQQLAQHLHLEHPHWKHTEEYLCQICDNVFINHRQLTTHLLRSHRKVFQSHCHLNKSVEQNGLNRENNLQKKPVSNSINLLKACKTTSKKNSHKKLRLGKSRRSSYKENHRKLTLVECEKGPKKSQERKNIFESFSEGSILNFSDPFTGTTANNHLAHVELNLSHNPVQLVNGSSKTLKTAIECLQSKISTRFSLPIMNGKRISENKTQSDSSLSISDLKRHKMSPCKTPFQNAHKRVMKKYHRYRIHMMAFTKLKYSEKSDAAESLSVQSDMSNNSFETEFLKSHNKAISSKVQEKQFDNSDASLESMDIPNLQHYQLGPIIDKSYKTMPDIHSPELTGSYCNEYSSNLGIYPHEDNVCENSDNIDIRSSRTISQFSRGSRHRSESNLDSDTTNNCSVVFSKFRENNNLNLENNDEYSKSSANVTKLDIEDDLSNILLEDLNCEATTEPHPYSQEVGRENSVKMESNDKLLSAVKWQQQFLSFIKNSINNVSTTSNRQNHQKKQSRVKRSNVCSCCILAATPGKKRRDSHKLVYPKCLTYVFPHGYKEFTKDMVCLLTLRHKVYRLLCTLFPRCLMVLQSMDPESEKVEILIDEIVGNLGDIDCYNTDTTQTESVEMNNNTRITSSITKINSHNPTEQATNQNNVYPFTGIKDLCKPCPKECCNLKGKCCSSSSTRNKCEIVCCDELDEAVIDHNINSNLNSETSDYFSEQNSTSPYYENLSQNSWSPGTEVICRDLDTNRKGKDFLMDSDKSFIKTDCGEMKCDGACVIDDKMAIIEDKSGRGSVSIQSVSAPTNQHCDRDEGIVIQEEAICDKHIQSDSYKAHNNKQNNNIVDFEKTPIEREYSSVTKDFFEKNYSVLSEEAALLKNYSFVVQDLPVCEGVSSAIPLSDLNAISCHTKNDLDKELISMKFHSDALRKDSLHSKPQIILCKKPESCLKVLKTKILALIHSLLPELPVRNYSSPEELEYLLDILRNVNEMSD